MGEDMVSVSINKRVSIMAATSNKVSVCGYCHIGLKGKKELKEHLSMGKNHLFKCVAKQAVEMVRMVKNGQRKFVCKECGKGFKTSGALTRHSNDHTKQMFVCDVEGCAKSYTRRSGMNLHKKIVHEGSSHECPECGKRFGQKVTLQKHRKMVHEKKKDYKCMECGVEFGRHSGLARHVQTVHEKIKAFKCELCNKSFSDAGNRKKHMQRMHIGYPCTWQGCNIQVSTTIRLERHIRHAHTKVKKVQSPVTSSGATLPQAVTIFTQKNSGKKCLKQRANQKSNAKGNYVEDKIETKLDQPPMVIIKEECLFNDHLEPQPPMVIIKEECIFNDQDDPTPPMVDIKEECLDIEDNPII